MASEEKATLGGATGGVRLVLRVEGVCVLCAAVLAYATFGLGWVVFAACFFVPDLSFCAYLAGPAIGACIYNIAHSYCGPVLLLGAGVMFAAPIVVAASLVWCAHIGFDRALGYGLKYASDFGFTHLGPIGRARHTAQHAEHNK